MALTVDYRSESGAVIDTLVPDRYGAIDSILPEFSDLRYPYLRLIDPYGDTCFSRNQMIAVLSESLTLVGLRLASTTPTSKGSSTSRGDIVTSPIRFWCS